MLEALKQDTLRYTQKWSWWQCIKTFLLVRYFRPIVTLRLAQAAPGWIRPLFKIAHEMVCWQACIDMGVATKIGPGLQFTHGRGIVISPNAVIGANVRIFHGVTLAAKEVNGELLAPTIEDDVVIGPGALIVGPVTIGRGSWIAGLSNVVEDVPAHSLVTPPKAVCRSQVRDIRSASVG